MLRLTLLSVMLAAAPGCTRDTEIHPGLYQGYSSAAPRNPYIRGLTLEVAEGRGQATLHTVSGDTIVLQLGASTRARQCVGMYGTGGQTSEQLAVDNGPLDIDGRHFDLPYLSSSCSNHRITLGVHQSDVRWEVDQGLTFESVLPTSELDASEGLAAPPPERDQFLKEVRD
jgi:hypothetical protein